MSGTRTHDATSQRGTQTRAANEVAQDPSKAQATQDDARPMQEQAAGSGEAEQPTDLQSRVEEGIDRVSKQLDAAAAAVRGEEDEVDSEVKMRNETMDRLDRINNHLYGAMQELGQLRSRVGSTQ